MSRRALLRVMLAAAAVLMLGALIVRTGRPAAAATSVGTWAWFPLPGAGLEVCLTEQRDPRKVSVSWTSDGTVTAFGATVTAGPTSVTVIAGSRSLSVRRTTAA